MITTAHNMGHCALCGRDFVDGDEAKDRTDGSVHRNCEKTEEAIEATWQDQTDCF